MTRVLVVDDEPQIIRAVRINLLARHYEVITAADGAGALRAAADRHPDLVLLDLGLPDMDGVDVVRSLRSWSPVPILVLSGRLDSRAKVDALDAGADDYITKPFNVDELLARIRAVTRRTTGPEADQPVRLGRWSIDFTDHLVIEAPDSGGRGDGSAGGGQVHLTPTEWQLLRALLRHPGRLVAQRQLLQEVWGPTYIDQTHYLRQFMKGLRHKLEDDPRRPRHLITESGMGYRFQP